MLACEKGYTEEAKLLIENGAKFSCLWNGKQWSLFDTAIFHNRPDLVKMLIKAKVELNHPYDDAKSPLEYACRCNKTKIAVLLIVAGAKCSQKEVELVIRNKQFGLLGFMMPFLSDEVLNEVLEKERNYDFKNYAIFTLFDLSAGLFPGEKFINPYFGCLEILDAERKTRDFQKKILLMLMSWKFDARSVVTKLSQDLLNCELKPLLHPKKKIGVK